MKLKPTEDRILVLPLQSESKTPGGIIIPETAKEKPAYGEIKAVGPGKRDENGNHLPMAVKLGDKVLFAKWSGTEVKHENVEMLIMKESDVLAIVE